MFDENGCTIRNSKKEVLINVKPRGGVYRIKGIHKCFLASSSKKPTAMNWHRKLAHVNYQYLLRMKKDPQYGIEFDDDDHEIAKCEVCAKGKQCRTPFSKSETKSTEPLQLIHSDLMENKKPSYGGARYLLTFVDDFSRKVFVYFLKNKSEVFDTFIGFKNTIENQTGLKIKKMRTDNGGEYISKEFEAYCRVIGIERDLTIPDTPEQNGVAERMNRTLTEKARCLMFDADLDKQCWAEACHMAAYIRNRTPSSSLNFKSPQEVWTGESVNLSKLKLFGTPIMVHIPKKKRAKFDEKSSKMVFVGYDDRAKAYRCLNPTTGKVILSRDVIFHEQPSSKINLEIEESVSDKPNSQDEVNSPEKVPEDEPVTQNQSEETDMDSTLVSSPANNVQLDDTAATLGNNTSADDDFEDAINQTTAEDTGSDPTYTTKAKVDEPSTPRSSGRQRRAYVPFQISHFALITTEPSQVAEAMNGEESIHWKKAMEEEMDSHRKNATWELTKLPNGAKAIEGKWVYKRKTNSSGEITRYKARFVAKGFAQRYGRDYNETFSPVVRHSTIRFLLALAVKNGMKIYQMDAETAFLQGDLHETVYMKQAEGYDDGSGQVYRLKKAIYGLKQASRMWNMKLNDVLLKQGFKRSKTDPCVYHRNGIIIAVYVDDFMIFYIDEGELLKLKNILHANFNMKDLGLASSCLGINIKQSSNFIEIDQSHYIKQVLERFGMKDCKPAPTPSDVNQKMSISMWNEENSLVGKVPYQELIGSLLYLSGATRPDIAFAVNDLSRFNNNHAEPHWKALKRILRYLKGTIDMKLRYEKTENNDMVAYSDADWGADSDKRRSCTGYVVNMSNGAISWCSQRQSIVALSTTESEYIALSTTVREIIWLKQLAKEVGNIQKNVIVHCDNQSAIDLGESEAYRPRTKHIDIRFHHIREKIENGVIDLVYIPTEKMVADSLTKPVSTQKTNLCNTGMGLCV